MVWPLIVGGALLAGGTAASMYGNNKATRAGNAVLAAERARQRGLDAELGQRTDQLLESANPSAAMGDELRLGGNASAELGKLGDNIQAGAGETLTPGRNNRVQTAARAIARSRAAKKKSAEKDLERGQFTLDRSRIQQRSKNSQEIAGIEAEQASQKGAGWRTAGGLMQSAGFLSMMA